MTQEIDKHQFQSIFVVYQRLQNNSNTNQTFQKTKSPVYGQININAIDYFNDEMPLSKLVRITEIIKDGDVLERQVDPSNIWINEEIQNGNKVNKSFFLWL